MVSGIFDSIFARLTEWGGGLKLFGQCPYRTNTFQKGASLTFISVPERGGVKTLCLIWYRHHECETNRSVIHLINNIFRLKKCSKVTDMNLEHPLYLTSNNEQWPSTLTKTKTFASIKIMLQLRERARWKLENKHWKGCPVSPLSQSFHLK